MSCAASAMPHQQTPPALQLGRQSCPAGTTMASQMTIPYEVQKMCDKNHVVDQACLANYCQTNACQGYAASYVDDSDCVCCRK